MSGAKGKALTVELVMTKTKCDNLNNIKNLNLWGNELQDLQIIQKMPNLQVISLSVNKINSLKEFAKCNKLQELYLRKNCIADLREIKYLLDLPHLKSLWLYDNPCAQQQNYREIVIHYLPNLNKLDNNVVSPEERTGAASQKYAIDLGSSGSQKQTNVVGSKKVSQNALKKAIANSQLQKQSNQGNYRGSSKQECQKERNIQSLTRNKNVLIAVLSLLKELDSDSLEIVKKEAQRQLSIR